MKKISTFLGVALACAFATTVALAQHDDHGAHPADPAHAADPAHPADPRDHAHPADPAHAADPAHHGDDHGATGMAHDAHAAAGGHHGPEPINWTDLSDKHRPAFIGLLINFGILVALYYTLGKKPVTEGLKQRRINVGKDIDEAKKMLEEAKERATRYQADLKNADADAATAKSSLISAGKGEVEKLVTEATERADRMQRDAERLVEQERKQIRQDLLVETIDKAVEEAHKVLVQTATPEDHARLANELLAELARKPAAPRVAPPTRSSNVTSGGVS